MGCVARRLVLYGGRHDFPSILHHVTVVLVVVLVGLVYVIFSHFKSFPFQVDLFTSFVFIPSRVLNFIILNPSAVCRTKQLVHLLMGSYHFQEHSSIFTWPRLVALQLEFEFGVLGMQCCTVMHSSPKSEHGPECMRIIVVL